MRRVERALEEIEAASRILTGAFEVQVERVNLVPLAGRLVAEFRCTSPTHRFSLAAPQGLIAVCDPRRIEALLCDLLQRALRRNPRGCWIDLDLRRPLAGVARIEVRDYGRALRERERLGAADRGWFINAHVVERHGGVLDVEYPPEGGVRVGVSLPTGKGKVAAP